MENAASPSAIDKPIREIPTPENWHWKITPEDVIKIKAFDRETINRVYFDNYDKFKSMCKRRFSNLWEDGLQTIYLLLPFCRYTNTQTFFRSLISGIKIYLFGRRSVSYTSLELDVFGDGESTLMDFIPFEQDFFHEKEEETRNVVLLLDHQSFLTDDQKDLLLSQAFGCQIFKGIFKYAKNRYCVA